MRVFIKTLSFSFWVVTLVNAQGMADTHREMRGRIRDEIWSREESLAPEQRTKIKEIRIETKKTIIPIRSQIELKEIDMKSEMEKNKPDREKIMKISREIHDLDWQIKKVRIEEKLKINLILTPEQREKMKMKRHRMIKKEIEKKEDRE